MIVPFDIFRAEADGSVLWRESAATLDQARARVTELAAAAPGDYIIFNQQTGTKVMLKLDLVDAA